MPALLPIGKSLLLDTKKARSYGLFWHRPQLDNASGGATQTRTGDKGFADLCLTTWLWRQKGIGAVDEIRTRDIHLGKVALYH